LTVLFRKRDVQTGTEIVHDSVKRHPEKKRGAVVFDARTTDGYPRVHQFARIPDYEGKELPCGKEFADFGTLDRNIHVVTPERQAFPGHIQGGGLIDPAKYKANSTTSPTTGEAQIRKMSSAPATSLKARGLSMKPRDSP
jgi:hypothetical protein